MSANRNAGGADAETVRVPLPWVVTIDGPAGVGKSTIARRLAEDFAWAHLDSGALYRAVALAALEAGVDRADEAVLGALVGALDPRLEPDGRVRLGDREVTHRLRSPEVTEAVARVAAVPAVRTRMVPHQRAFACAQGRVVAEGRDMGTVVFPDATVKIYLDAGAPERARRRRDQDAAGGRPAPTEAVLRDLEARDRQDRDRAVAPLRRAEDAWLLDTTRMTLDEVFGAVRSHVRSRIPVGDPPHSPA